MGSDALQALRLRRPWRYLGCELLRLEGARRYEIRATGVRVLLRHGTLDTRTFDEVFCSAAYEPPMLVSSMLDRLDRPPRVLDLGANVGLFSAFAMGRWPGARITAVEPDPENALLLRSCARLNVGRGEITVVEAIASVAAGDIRFVAGLEAESHRAHPDERDGVVVLHAVDVLPELVNADLVKIDIEGGEWELLGDSRLAGSGGQAVVVEHHGRHCPTSSPREAASQLLAAAGYEVQSHGPTVGGVGMVWAWRSP